MAQPQRTPAIKVYRINTGSCGGCDVEIDTAVTAGALRWADSPHDADALLLTGPLTPQARPAFLALWRELSGRVPLVAVGRCAVDGHPFGPGGLAANLEVTADLKLDGCPPAPMAIADAVRAALAQRVGEG